MISVQVPVLSIVGIKIPQHMRVVRNSPNRLLHLPLTTFQLEVVNIMQDLLLEMVYSPVQIQSDIPHSIFHSVIFSDLQSIRKLYTVKNILSQ